MRLRRKPWIEDAIFQFKDFVFIKDNFNAVDLKGNWHNIFANEAPLYVELGTGKGDFISQAAKNHPEINFLGLELQQDIIYHAAEKVNEAELTNVRLAVFDINHIEELLDSNEVQRFYINFCDPWPKKRHAKRRLTYISFLQKYSDLLVSGGELFFKTDNRPLFDFSLEQFKEAGCNLKNINYDLHSGDILQEDYMTEYERKFSAFGEKINRCEVVFP
ncbi:tRNA (guanosine(46)-N7)-methyltransferase TrmB [Pectinatus sottacetonis]|uniref:tRNA (guanosine(46)-N7)-methyltransferase TrmB n=1 Tax=Pectinatus sottacetonis TaxID=1002795 RepID=UPI0018C5F858|nr:tRNA (guanosine(46)-N7)-methyltransferase TrmB [Pectinatus sottacetonis]